jgi:hypothetical protein
MDSQGCNRRRGIMDAESDKKHDVDKADAAELAQEQMFVFENYEAVSS